MEKRVWCGMRIDLAWPLQLFRFAVISCWPRGKNGGKLLLNVSSLSNLLSPLFLSMLRAQISFLEADLGKYFQYFFPRSEISFSNLSRSNSMLTNFTRSHGWILNHSFFLLPFNLNHKLGWEKRLEERIRSMEIFFFVDPFCNKLESCLKNYFPYLCLISARSF